MGQISNEWIFNGVVSIALFFFGVWFRRLADDLKDLKNEIKDVRLTYQSKEVAKLQSAHTNNILSEIRDELKSMNHKLDNKVDK